MKPENKKQIESKKELVLQQSLLLLAHEINASYKATESGVELAQEANYRAVKQALACGKALNAAKKLIPHGEWLPWLEKNCKKVKERYARDLMALANRHHTADLKDSPSVRQALIACGVLPSVGETTPKNEQPALLAAPVQEAEVVEDKTETDGGERPRVVSGAPEASEPSRPVREKLPTWQEVVTEYVKEILAALKTVKEENDKKAAAKLLKPLKAWL